MGFNLLSAKFTLILLPWRMWWASNNASRWQMGFNTLSAKLTLILLPWRMWWAPNNASRWQMEFNWAFKGLNPICHLLALLGAHSILHISGVRVKIYLLLSLLCCGLDFSFKHKTFQGFTKIFLSAKMYDGHIKIRNRCLHYLNRWCTALIAFSTNTLHSAICLHTMFMHFVWVSQQTLTTSLNSTNRSVDVTENQRAIRMSLGLRFVEDKHLVVNIS
jgi:hypothetical protein